MLAKRRKLLNRDDWLALEPTRPLRLEFPAGAGGSSIGRRKKIKPVMRSAPRTVQRPPFSPVFREHLGNNDVFVSGAMPSTVDEPIHIKVGTSAFGSPHHARSNTSVSSRFSMADTTRASCLSEESMLLGADGDYFDAARVEVPTVRQALHRSTDQPLAVSSGSWMVSSSEREYDKLVINVSSLRTEYEESPRRGTVACREYRLTHSRSSPEATQPSPHGYRSDGEPSKQESPSIDKVYHRFHADRSEITKEIGDNPEAEPESESIWRRLIGIRALEENAASTKAVHSTSAHSDTSDTAFLSTSHRLVDYQNCGGRNPRQGAPIGACHERITPLHMQHQPLRVPFQVHLRQSEFGLPKMQDRSQEDDTEALWREFILGTSDTEDGNNSQISWKRESTGEKRSYQADPLKLDDSGASDRATQGDAIICGSPEASQYMSPDGADAVLGEIDSRDKLSIDNKREQHSPPNIHTIPMVATGLRRFKPRDRQPANIELENRNQPSKRFVRSRALR